MSVLRAGSLFFDHLWPQVFPLLELHLEVQMFNRSLAPAEKKLSTVELRRRCKGELTCQLPLLRRHLPGGLDHGDGAEVAVGDAHEQREETRPGGVGQRGAASRVHAHDEQRDEDHSQAGEEEQAAPRPFVGQGGQDLGGGGARESEVQTLLKDSILRLLCGLANLQNHRPT